jgi:glycerol-3-phosphate acyltransferase PlsX
MAESMYDITHEKKIGHEYFERFNFEIYGGTPVLGVAKPVIIGHGISHSLAFKNMILAAQKMVDKKVLTKMKEELEN